MRELGAQEERLHDELASDIQQAGISILITVGPLAKRIAAKLARTIDVLSFDDADGASRGVPPMLRPGDLVAIKGSRAVALPKVVTTIMRSAMKVSIALGGWQIEDEQP